MREIVEEAGLAVAVADGADAISGIAVLTDRQELFGPVASMPTAWRVLDRVDEAHLSAVHAVRARARAAAWATGASPRPGPVGGAAAHRLRARPRPGPLRDRRVPLPRPARRRAPHHTSATGPVADRQDLALGHPDRRKLHPSPLRFRLTTRPPSRRPRNPWRTAHPTRQSGPPPTQKRLRPCPKPPERRSEPGQSRSTTLREEGGQCPRRLDTRGQRQHERRHLPDRPQRRHAVRRPGPCAAPCGATG